MINVFFKSSYNFFPFANSEKKRVPNYHNNESTCPHGVIHGTTAFKPSRPATNKLSFHEELMKFRRRFDA